MKNCIFTILMLAAPVLYAMAQVPTHLTTDLIENTDMVSQDGYVSTMPLDKSGTAIERFQIPTIHSTHPTFGWVVNSTKPNTRQTAYRIIIATSQQKIAKDSADVWDSGKVSSDNSTTVVYTGQALKPRTKYYWKVKTWDNHGTESPYSSTRGFLTARSLDGTTARYPLQITNEHPAEVRKFSERGTFIAFEKAAFGKLLLTLSSATGQDTVQISLGEKSLNSRVYRLAENTKSSIRYTEYRLPLRAGTHTYIIKFRPDSRNTESTRNNESGVLPVFMPDYIGEVYPFRFCEVEGYAGTIDAGGVARLSVHYPFNDQASYFHSSDSVLNKVWNLCKYTIKATSFTGVYVDGDRERIAYEADAIIGQLGHYSTDREFTMARHSHEYLLENPTWPTEWNLQSVIIAWNDYMYTGDSRSIARYYDVLKAKTLNALKGKNGLISTRTGKLTPDFYKSINFRGKTLRDIVDWPQSGYIGEEKERPGEADGFVRTTYNTVVNAFHYQAVKLMADIAQVLGKDSDAVAFDKEARLIKKAFNRLLFDKRTGHYHDGVDTPHQSLHANMFPMAFGLVPDKNKREVMRYIKSRRMACSVYGAQFLMDALYDENQGDYAMTLLSSTGERSWYNMLRAGSTITMEAWDDKYKPNQDWNHVWGAVPANIIPRGLFGIKPIEPAFKTFTIKPQPGKLQKAELRLPTIKGDISVSFDTTSGKQFTMTTIIPANTTAIVSVPMPTRKAKLTVDGNTHEVKTVKGFATVRLGSGKHELKAE